MSANRRSSALGFTAHLAPHRTDPGQAVVTLYVHGAGGGVAQTRHRRHKWPLPRAAAELLVALINGTAVRGQGGKARAA